MIEARRATVDDTAELIRLRGVLFDAPEESDQSDWRAAAREALLRCLAEAPPSMAAFVVDEPDRTGRLAACAVGVLDLRLANPRNPTGRVGYVFNVATDPEHRRRGYARACMSALIEWFRAEGVTAVDLRASPDGEPLYASQGFVHTADPSMRLSLRRD